MGNDSNNATGQGTDMNTARSDVRDGPGLPPSAMCSENERPPRFESPIPAGIELAQGFWAKTPTVTWVMDAGGCLYQFGEVFPESPGREAARKNQPSRTGLQAADILRQFSRRNPNALVSRHPVQAVESLPGPDGETHDFLVIRFRFSDGDGTPYVAGLALDITRHKMRVDELAHQAVIDELTGLYNRRGFSLFAEHELKAARRRRTRSALIFIDIDGLKRINDTYGHDAGNEVLIRAGECFRQEFRECDVIARVGGDEFAIFAPDMNGDPEHLRHRLSAHLLKAAHLTRHHARLSVSIGLSSCGPNDSTGLADLMAAADYAMYREKGAKKQAANVQPGAGI